MVLRLLYAIAHRDHSGDQIKPVAVLMATIMPVSVADKPIRRQKIVKNGISEALAAAKQKWKVLQTNTALDKFTVSIAGFDRQGLKLNVHSSVVL